MSVSARPARRLLALCALCPGLALLDAGAHPHGVAAARADTSAVPRLVGSVWDSLAGAPLVGASVVATPIDAPDQGAAEGRVTLTDSLGEFAFAGLAPGRHLVRATHPLLDSAGLWDGVGDTARLAAGTAAPALLLSTPSRARVAGHVCGPAWVDVPTMPGRDTARVVLYGVVHGATSDAPVAGASVHVRWLGTVLDTLRDARSSARRATAARLVELGARATTNASGTWALCLRGPRAELDAFTVQAGDGADASAVLVTVGAAGIRRLDLVADAEREGLPDSPPAPALDGAPPSADSSRVRDVGASVARDSAPIARWLVGTVRDSAGRPVEGARVALADQPDRPARTDAAGRWRLAVPRLGTRTLQVRALGFAAYDAPVAIARRAPETVDVVLSRVTVLTRVDVREQRRDRWRLRRIEEIAYQRQRGLGVVVDSMDLARWNYSVGAALGATRRRTWRSPNLSRWGGQGGRGAPCLIIDGFAQVLGGVMPDGRDIAAVEAYADEAGGIPLAYQASCGGWGRYSVTVVWTKAYLVPPPRLTPVTLTR